MTGFSLTWQDVQLLGHATCRVCDTERPLSELVQAKPIPYGFPYWLCRPGEDGGCFRQGTCDVTRTAIAAAAQ
jgi:hypothetical protein